MRLRCLPATCMVLFSALIVSFGVVAHVRADPHQSPRAATPAVASATLTSKVTLPETSIDGPALSSVVGSFEGVSFNKSAIAWTGTDAAHHLNVETSSDGLHFGHKLTLDETSPFRPDVTQIGEPAGGQITVAWTGSDTHHLLNVLFDVYGGHPIKLTLPHDTSFTAPAIAQRGETLFLAWTGTDPNHSLNFLPITIGPSTLTPGTKEILSQFSSNAGPHLSTVGSAVVLLSWTTQALVPKIASAGTDFVFGFVATLERESSAFAPATLFLDPNGDWVSWTGTDAAHHLNLQFTTTFPSFPTAKTVLDELALGGPALAFNDGNQLAWTGTDAQHHLNIAKFT